METDASTQRAIKKINANFNKAERIRKQTEANKQLFASQKALNEAKLDAKTSKYNLGKASRQHKLDVLHDKNKFREDKLNANAKRGFIKGAIARHRLKKNAKFESEVELIKNEPKMKSKERILRAQTDAEVKKTKAKGAAFAVGATALGEAYTKGKSEDKEAAIAQAEADKAAANSLGKALNRYRDIKDPYDSEDNTAGLTDGVR